MYRQDCCKHKVLSDKKKSLVSYYKEYLWHIEDVYNKKGVEPYGQQATKQKENKIRLRNCFAGAVEWYSIGTQCHD
jgi:hypothetical protein